MTGFQSEALVGHVNAQNVAVVQKLFGDVVFEARPEPEEQMLPFDAVLRRPPLGFVGRTRVFSALEAFRSQHECGYFEVSADAGLGKTALAAEIARRYNAISFFASASQGVVRSSQFLTHASASLVVGYQLAYKHLPATVGDDATFFERVLYEAAKSPRGVLIVVDALDEAESPGAEANPLLLPATLPSRVHIVVTRRAGVPLQTYPPTMVESIALRRDDPEQKADIESYVRKRASDDPAIVQALAETQPATSIDQVVATLTAASDGNFMYLEYVLGDVAHRRIQLTSAELAKLPSGLVGYYGRIWARIEPKKVENRADWLGLYRPVIERLAVAREAVTPEWLATQIERSVDDVRDLALEPWARFLSREQRAGGDVWRVVHRSFADYLGTKVDLAAANLAVAEHYGTARLGSWSEWDDYGLRHTATHFAEAARGVVASNRHPIVDSLVRLVAEASFRAAQLDRLRDASQCVRDLELTLKVAAEDGEKPVTLMIGEVALTLLALRRELRRGSVIFEHAARGEVVAAERRLDLFSLDDSDWQQAVLLTVAWLASSTNREQARLLRDRVSATLGWAPTLQLLRALVSETLDATPVVPPALGPTPTLHMAEAIVARLSGSTYNESLLAGPGAELLNRGMEELLAGGGATPDELFLSATDGPLLVAFAAADSSQGDELLRRYLDIHAAYGYRHYRAGSLWVLLGSILRHPSRDWVRRWVRSTCEALLAPIRGDFLEGLDTAVLASRVAAGDPIAGPLLDLRRNEALTQAQATIATSAGGQADVWAIQKRRLGALAEVFTSVPDGAGHATTLLRHALDMPYGFAGFNAPACLTLAESVSIVAPGDTPAIQGAIDAARASAHNVTDPVFCLRNTARVNAMSQRWWTSTAASSSTAQVVDSFCRDSSGPAFASLHLVGESYPNRRTVPLPVLHREALALRDLAQAYRRPLNEFIRLNSDRGWSADTVLAPATKVLVPDPGMPPLLAARLSAQVLVDRDLSDQDRRLLLQRLAVVASRDTTALGTVLTRLLLASGVGDVQALRRLQELTAASVEATLRDEPPAAVMPT